MSDDWEEFMDTRDGIERKVYHFYWDKFHLYMIKDEEGNILAGTGPNTWNELYSNPNLRKERKKKLDDLHKVRIKAQREKKMDKAHIILHGPAKATPRKKAKKKISGKKNWT